jgi:hypothetical protein
MAVSGRMGVKEMRERRRLISAGLATLMLIGLIIGAMFTPAVAHIGTPAHLWNEHLRPRADARYYTKAAADVRFAQAPMWAHVREDGIAVAQSPEVTVAHPSAGTYYVTFPRRATSKPIAVTISGLSGDTSAELSATPCGGGVQGVTCAQSDNIRTIRVLITGGLGFAVDSAFFVRVG